MIFRRYPTLSCALFFALTVACSDDGPSSAGSSGGGGGEATAGATSVAGQGAGASGGANQGSGAGAGTAGLGGTSGLAGAGGSGSGGVTSGGNGNLGGNGGSGGLAGSSGAGGAGGTPSTYHPCPPAPEACKIMPSGDSITVGAQSTDTGGYRAPLFGLTLENGKNLTFVGPSGAGPESVDGEPFPDAHDGHSGYVIDTVESRKGILPLMQQNLTKHAPHIVLLMIGTNDINSDVEVANAPNRLATLIDEITGTAPESLLVVAQIIPTRTDELNLKVQTFNAAIPAIVSERAAAGKHVLLVDMYGAFTQNAAYKTDLLYDGLHPNDAGYAVMAETWYAAIAEFLSARP